MTSGSSKLLILDLDETLVRVTEEPLEREADFEFGEYWVYARPHVREFLEFCASNFRVAVWTSSTEEYAEAIVKWLFGENYPLEFVWARKRCTQRFDPELYTHEWVKDLKKVKRRGFPLEQVIMLDDTPRKLARNYGNLLRVGAFEGDLNDRELQAVMPYLLSLKEVADIRSEDKRGWLTI